MFVGPTALWHWIGKEGELVSEIQSCSLPQTYWVRICIVWKPAGGWCSQYRGISAALEKGLGGHEHVCSPREYDRGWRESIGLEGADQRQSKQVRAEVWKEGKSNHVSERGAFIYSAKLTFKKLFICPCQKVALTDWN